MRSRLSTSLPGLVTVGITESTRLPRCSLLDSLLVQLALKDAIHIDTRRVDQIGFQLANLDQMLDFGNCYFGSSCHHRIEVAGRFSINEIAPLVTLPGFHQR